MSFVFEKQEVCYKVENGSSPSPFLARGRTRHVRLRFHQS